MNYFHVHSMLSNATTTIDSITRYDKYIEKAKSYDCKAFGFSEHGNVLEWHHKKQAIEKAGMKYIHGVEVYVTKNIEERVRDNYHVILMARNFEGFKELNKLVSIGFNRSNAKVIDNKERFYYNPRISYDELKNISDNILLTSACLGGILNSNDKELREDFIRYMAKNRHKCFLEIQHHLVKDQADYNRYLVELHNIYDIPLIAGTDTHMVTDDEAKGRELLQKRKNIHFENEDGWSLALYDYETLKQMYKKQNAINEKYYIQALENTDLLYDLIDEYKIDTSRKYPRLSNDSYNEVMDLCKKGIKDKRIENTEELHERLLYELEAYKHNDALDFMLLEYDVKKWARENDIFYGESRGSVSGSMVAYLMGITKVNSMRYNLNFERFMNKERVSLADIDSDWMPSKREMVKEYLHNNSNYHTAEIITFNTIAEKGSIRDIGGALEIPLKIINDICDNIENKDVIEKYKKQYPDLFKYAKQVEGTITSVGSHPAATICSPIDIVENIGTITLPTNKYPISALNMKEIDSLNFVKLDVLGLDNIEIIYKTCKLANIEPLTSDNVDFDDEKVWEDILKSPVGIFQFESDFAHNYLKQVFSKETLSKIGKFNPNINYLYLMSVANGAIRPAGQSYRDALAQGLLRDNGHKALNDFLKDTNGYLVFQEQIIEFLNKFCGFTMGEADIIRRGFAKKTGTEQYIPQIKSGFIKTMQEKYGVDKDKSEQLIIDFIKVIEDASDYLFSLNHSLPYSMIGYMCGWLRHYYPLEFITVLLEINANNQEKTSAIYDYINQFTDIKVKPVEFRYSRANYAINKTTNSIYKGLSSIKNLNSDVAEELYLLKDNVYNNFFDLLKDIKQKTTCNATKLDTLIKVDFFKEFGSPKYLLECVNIFNELKNGNAKQITVEKAQSLNIPLDIFNRYGRLSDSGKTYLDLNIDGLLNEINEYLQCTIKEEFSILEKIQFQQEFLGYIDISTNKEEDRRKLIVLDIKQLISKKTNKVWAYSCETMSLGSGKTSSVTIGSYDFDKQPIEKYSIIYAKKLEKKNNYWWVTSYYIVD